MRGFCLFEITKAQNNAEYRKKLENKNKYMWLVIVIGLITAVIAFCTEFSQIENWMISCWGSIPVLVWAGGGRCGDAYPEPAPFAG